MPRGRCCPQCGNEIPIRRQEKPRYAGMSLALFGAAGLVSLIWCVLLFHVVPPAWAKALVPDDIEGLVGFLIVGLGPGLLIGWVAASRPKRKTLRCRCGWSETVEVRG